MVTVSTQNLSRKYKKNKSKWKKKVIGVEITTARSRIAMHKKTHNKNSV